MIAWILGVLAAPRRLRELGRRHDELRRRFQVEKMVAKRELAAANAEAEHARRRLAYYRDQRERIAELEARIETLRGENGENYRKYVRVQHRLDLLCNRPARETPYGGCP